MTTKLWDVHKAPWWQAAPGREQFLAYYMNMRVHYEMPAKEALDYARKNADALDIHGAGFMGMLKQRLEVPE